MIADMAVVMSLLMITSGLAVTRSPTDTEAFPDFLASSFSLIVMGMNVPLLVSDNETCLIDRIKTQLPAPLLHWGRGTGSYDPSRLQLIDHLVLIAKTLEHLACMLTERWRGESH